MPERLYFRILSLSPWRGGYTVTVDISKSRSIPIGSIPIDTTTGADAMYDDKM